MKSIYSLSYEGIREKMRWNPITKRQWMQKELEWKNMTQKNMMPVFKGGPEFKVIECTPAHPTHPLKIS